MKFHEILIRIELDISLKKMEFYKKPPFFHNRASNCKTHNKKKDKGAYGETLNKQYNFQVL